MSLFNFTPQQYYSRTPTTNQPSVNFNLTDGVYVPAFPTGIAAYNGYNSPQIPGTTGYRLPAQNYYNYGVSNPSLFGTQTLKTSLVNTAINSAVQGLVYGLTGGPSTDPTGGRLSGTGVAVGATASQLLQPSNNGSNTAWQDNSEDRVFISDNTGLFINAGNPVFRPLDNLGGVLFPYTPVIQITHKASYEMLNLVHTNYTTPAYQHSAVENISVQGQFTANTPAEAEYVVAVIHYFRTVTKMFYGQDQLAGTPPPVLNINGYGPYTLDNIPVVCTSFDYSLPNDVDYISCTVNGDKQKVPTSLNINLSLVPTYSRNKISNKFGLDKFSKGQLLSQSGTDGGWL
jgi:hypothetical protein